MVDRGGHVDKHVVKLSIDTTLHRDLTIGEWTAVVVRDVLADHRLWGTVFRSRFNFCEYVAHWGKCMKAAALSKFVNRWVWQKLPKPSVRKHLCQRHVQSCAQWRPYIWNPENLSWWQCKQTEEFFSAEKHRLWPICGVFLERPYSTQLQGTNARWDVSWTDRWWGTPLLPSLPTKGCHKICKRKDWTELHLALVTQLWNLHEFVWYIMMHRDSWCSLHAFCLVCLQGIARYAETVLIVLRGPPDNFWKQFAMYCSSLRCQKLGHSRSLNASQRLAGTARPHLKPQFSNGSHGCREMPGDAGGSSWIRWEMLRILRRRGSNHLETLTDCTLSCCHHGWNRIRSFVLGNHAETKSALPSLADGKKWKKQDKTCVLQRVNNWLLVGGITSLSSSLIDSNFLYTVRLFESNYSMHGGVPNPSFLSQMFLPLLPERTAGLVQAKEFPAPCMTLHSVYFSIF